MGFEIQAREQDAAIARYFALFALGVILTTLYSRNIHLDVDRVLLGTPELAPLNRLSSTEYDFGPISLLLMGVMFC
jgi:manganese/zinc/iron transport system permease protein